jgi:hypothetical protein
MLQTALPASGRVADPEAMDVDNPGPAKPTEDRLASEQASKLKELAEKVEGFVAGEGDLEGARFEEYVLCLSYWALL